MGKIKEKNTETIIGLFVFMESNETYRNRRCRLQRLSDSKLMYGWVINYDKKNCTIRLNGKNLNPQVNDKFNVEIFGRDSNATFQAFLHHQSEEAIFLQANSFIQYKNKTENGRVLLYNGTGNITVGEDRLNIDVIDISESGAAISAPEAITAKSRVRLVIQAGKVTVNVYAEVAYCRKNFPAEGQFRLGVKFIEMDRFNQALISELVSTAGRVAA